MEVLSTAERNRFVEAHPEWTLEDETLVRTYTFSDFVDAFAFATRVALLAEKAFHHPVFEINWNTVTLRLTTHSAGGLTTRDVELAASIDG